MINVGIDIRILSKGTKTGVENYVTNLLLHLLSKDKSINYKLFYSGFKQLKGNYPWPKLKNVEVKSFKIPNRFLDLSLRFLKFPKIDKLVGDVDIFLSPHFLLLPVTKKTKTIVVFHDLSFVRFPEFFSFPKMLWHKFVYPQRQARNADLIVAVSNSTKEDLINLYQIPEEKIRVIYSAAGEEFMPIKKEDPNLLRTKEKYHLPDKFILYFGTIEPRKNILALIEAFEKIKAKKIDIPLRVRWNGFEGFICKNNKKVISLDDLKLVIAGNKGWLYRDVFNKIRNSLFRKDIIVTGFIEENDRPYLYNLSELFVYPSFFEGFGFPPLEAMACGVPALVSNRSSLAEVVGNAALMFNPHNIDEIAFAIKEVLENQNLRNILITRGLKRARNFHWDKTAESFLKLFEELCSR